MAGGYGTCEFTPISRPRYRPSSCRNRRARSTRTGVEADAERIWASGAWSAAGTGPGDANSDSPQAATWDQDAKSLSWSSANGSYHDGRSASRTFGGTPACSHTYSRYGPTAGMEGSRPVAWRAPDSRRPGGHSERERARCRGTASPRHTARISCGLDTRLQ